MRYQLIRFGLWMCRHGFHAWAASRDGVHEVCARCALESDIEDWWI